MYNKPTLKGEWKDDCAILSTNKNIDGLRRLDSILIASIDPAYQNFVLRIEERIPIKGSDKYKVITKVFTHNKFDDPRPYTQIIKHFSYYEKYIKELDLVLIERQPPKRRDVIEIEQHCGSYFLIMCPKAIVINLSGKVKKRMLGAPSKLDYNETKKWSVNEAYRILKDREDTYGLEVFNSKKTKLDDLADTIVQAEAFFIMKGFGQMLGYASLNNRKTGAAGSLKYENNRKTGAAGSLKYENNSSKNVCRNDCDNGGRYDIRYNVSESEDDNRRSNGRSNNRNRKYDDSDSEEQYVVFNFK